MNSSPPGSSVHGILLARMLEWVAIPYSRESSQRGITPTSLESAALAGRFFTTMPAGKPIREADYPQNRLLGDTVLFLNTEIFNAESIPN